MKSHLAINAKAGAVQAAAPFLDRAKRELAELGIVSLQVRTDFSELKGMILDPCLGINVLWHHFDPQKFDVPPLAKRAVWICGKTASGRVVHVQAMRCDHLGDGTLEEQMASFMPSIGGGLPNDVVPRARERTGTIVYHGANWIHPDFRDHQAGGWTVRYGAIFALVKWWPDWLWGLFTQPTAVSGFAQRSMYPHIQPLVASWDVLPEWEDDCWLSSMSRSEALWGLRMGHEPYVRAR